jgi:hypothetical protein
MDVMMIEEEEQPAAGRQGERPATMIEHPPYYIFVLRSDQIMYSSQT